MKKIVINSEFGGFGLSEEAIKEYARIKGLEVKEIDSDNIGRCDPILVQLVEVMGEKSWETVGSFAKLKIVEIPEDVDWIIHSYDGKETIHEKHRSWE